MDYKVYILIKHASKTITFYKTFDAILSDINIRFIHTFIFDFEYYETHKLTKNEKSYCLKFKKFDILEFNINNEEELSFSYNQTTGIIPTTSSSFLIESLKYINKSIEETFTDKTNTEIKIYSGKHKNYKTFTISNFYFLYDIHFEEINI